MTLSRDQMQAMVEDHVRRLVESMKERYAMDPDAAIRELRELHASGGPGDFERAMELIIELDRWLQKGGTPPKDWQPAWRRHG